VGLQVQRAQEFFENFVDLILYRTSQSAQETAYTFLENGEVASESITYGQLRERVLALAAALQQQCAPGDRVLLLYPPCVDYMIGFLACLCAGTIAVPLFPPRGTKHNYRLEAIARDCQPRLALISTKRLPRKNTSLQEQSGLASLQLLCSDSIDPANASAWRKPTISSATIAFLQYTSGSTGLPKGVMVSHGNLIHNEQLMQACYGTDASSTVVTWLPIYHDMGLIGNMLAAFWLGSTCVFMASAAFLQRPIRWLQAISDYRGYFSGAPNFAFDLCVERISEEQKQRLNLSSWKIAFCGAEPIRLETLERFANAFVARGLSRDSLWPSYGLAEATLMVCASGSGSRDLVPRKYVDKDELTRRRAVATHNGNSHTLVSCGRTAMGQTIRIVNEVTNKMCGPGEIGEIWVSGGSIAQGYWNREETNSETFRARIAGSSEGSFLRTGDLGFIDDGDLYITGRIKDVIIIRGANHYPQDIEQTIEAADRAVNRAGAAAFGICDSEVERVVAVVEVARTSLRKVDVEALIQTIRRGVVEAHDIALSDVMLIRPGSLPKSSSGKVQRGQCRSMYLANELEKFSARNVTATDAIEHGYAT
jgi:acyl-CoA synthetase (AMP-forming)/AMP-acid ligase II